MYNPILKCLLLTLCLSGASIVGVTADNSNAIAARIAARDVSRSLAAANLIERAASPLLDRSDAPRAAAALLSNPEEKRDAEPIASRATKKKSKSKKKLSTGTKIAIAIVIVVIVLVVLIAVFIIARRQKKARLARGGGAIGGNDVMAGTKLGDHNGGGHALEQQQPYPSHKVDQSAPQYQQGGQQYPGGPEYPPQGGQQYPQGGQQQQYPQGYPPQGGQQQYPPAQGTYQQQPSQY